MLLMVPLWLVLFAILVGWGLLVRWGLERASRGAIRGVLTTFQTMWLGYAGLLAFLLVYSLVLPVGRPSIAAASLPAIAGFVLQRHVVVRTVQALRAPWRTMVVIACVTLVAWLLVAYAACDVVTWYDTDLYHVQVVKWNATYPAVPGLANLHLRFGYDNSVHVFGAFVDAFWEGVAVHAMNGFLLAALLAQWAVEIFTARTPRGRLRQTYCLFTLPFVLSKVWTIEVASFSTDLALAIFCLVLVLELLSLPRASRERLLPSLALVLAIAVAALTTKLGGLALFAVTVVTAVVLVGRRVPKRTWLVLLAVPTVLLIAWLVRNVIVSGWLVFPVFGRLPLSWSVPAEVGAEHLRWIESWARLPQQSPDAALGHGFLHWFVPWFGGFRQSREMILLAISAALLAFRVAGGPSTAATRRTGEWAAIAACVAGIAQWFVGAPDLRFGGFLFWMLPAVLFAPMVAGSMRVAIVRNIVTALALVACAWSGGFTPRLDAVAPKLRGRPPAPMRPPVIWLDAGRGTRVSTPRPPDPVPGEPPKPKDDRCGDADLLCTPDPGRQTLRDSDDLGAGFYSSRP